MEKPRTKIVATIGPASEDETTLLKMIRAGMNVARLNFSHGTHEDHEKIFRRIRTLSQKLGKPLAIMQDLQGVKIRVGELPAPIQLNKNAKTILTTSVKVPEGLVPVDYPELHKLLKQSAGLGFLELLVPCSHHPRG